MQQTIGWMGWLARRGAIGGGLIGAGYGLLAPFLILALNTAGLIVWPFSYTDVTIAGCLCLLLGGGGGALFGAVLALLAGGLGALATRLLGYCSPALVQMASVVLGTAGVMLVCIVLDLPGAYQPSWTSTGWSFLGWTLGLAVPALAGAIWAWRVSYQGRARAMPG